jgi:hypothetical protein
MLGGPIDIAPIPIPDIFSIDFHKYSIGDHRTGYTAPIVVRGINKLHIVIIRRAVDYVIRGIALEDVVIDIRSG